MTTDQKIKSLISELSKMYPEPKLALNFSNGFELLVAVILSAQCTDDRVNKVTTDLFKKYSAPGDYVKASDEDLQEDIRSTGFYKNKARALKACCQKLSDEFQDKIPQHIDELTTLPGVGRKTAAMVLGNAYGINEGIAVDTHVKRVIQRLEISKENNVDKMEKELMELIPREKWTWASNAAILFGRNICQSRKPKCPECPLRQWCPYPDKTN